MDRLIWSQKAAADLEQIVEFISRDSPQYAGAFARKVLDLAEDIVHFPGAGRKVPEFHNTDLRERLIGNYRVIYRVKSDAVELVAVVHGHRLLG